MHYVEDSTDSEEENNSWNISELPMIDGLDWKYAAEHFNDQESMLETVKFFVSTIEYDAKELEALYSAIENERGRKEYCTKVHSMKNSASIIGMIPLAGMAKVLEDAARNNEEDVLRPLTQIFLKRWRASKEHLSIFSEVVSEKKKAIDYQQEVEEIFKAIREAAEDMDIDALDALLMRLEEFEFENEQAQIFSEIQKAVINFDVEFLKSI